MKSFKVIIAFLVIYLFINVVAILVGVSLWLNTFTASDSDEKIVATVIVSPKENSNANSVQVIVWQEDSALISMFSRGTRQSTTKSKIYDYTITGGTLKLAFYNMELSDNLIAAGFKRMVKLGRTTYENGGKNEVKMLADDWFANLISRNISGLRSFFDSTSVESIEITPSSITEEYDIILSDSGLSLVRKGAH